MIWLDQYNGETTNDLLKLQTTHDISSIVEAVNEGLDQKAYRTKTARNDVEIAIPAIIELDREVKNGGYSQFLRNSSRRYIPVIVSALEKVDCPQTLKITKAALAALPSDWEKYTPEQLNSVTDAFDSEFYQTGEDLYALLFKYICKNRAAITLP